jgi:hypothetical protein
MDTVRETGDARPASIGDAPELTRLDALKGLLAKAEVEAENAPYAYVSPYACVIAGKRFGSRLWLALRSALELAGDTHATHTYKGSVSRDVVCQYISGWKSEVKHSPARRLQ